MQFTKVTGILTQGYYASPYWTKTFSISYTNDMTHFEDYKEFGLTKVISCCLTYNKVVSVCLTTTQKCEAISIVSGVSYKVRVGVYIVEKKFSTIYISSLSDCE